MAGQIIPRGERSWLVRVFAGRDSETGKRQYQSKTIHGTKKDAQRYLTESLRDRDMGIVVEPETAGLGRYLDKWLETSAKPRLRAKTLEDYRQLLARYVRPELGGRPLAKIRPLEIQALYQGMQDRGLSARTVRYTHAVLHSALSQAVKWRMLAQNPAENVDLPRQQRTEMRVLTPDQTRLFLDAAKLDRLGTMFAVAVTTGLRPSEYLALKWSDIDFATTTLSVSRTLEWMKGGGWQFQDTKRSGSRRTIGLQNSVCAMLQQHRLDQAKERSDAAEAWQETGLVFTTRSGGPLDERNIAQENFARILTSAGLAPIRLYDLRHTAATNALGAGVSPKVVSEMLGHASVAFTLDVYAHVLPHMQKQAAATVEALLFPAPATAARPSHRTRAGERSCKQAG
jgi:integrase